MTDEQINSLKLAVGTGEVLVAIYSAGSAPGHKRRIVVSGVDTDSDHLSVIENGARKTYFISKTRIVPEDDPAPWMPENSGKVEQVDPLEYFSGWAYTIRPELFVALGVFPRRVIDKEKTRIARENAIARGMSKTEATRRVKVMRREIVINTPPVYAFEVGDIFYRGIFGGQDWLQVAAIDSRPEGIFYEAHFPMNDGRIGFRLSDALIALALKTGILPDQRYRIGTTLRTSLMLL